MSTIESTDRRTTAITALDLLAAAKRVWSALRNVMLRRACIAAKAEMSTIGDAPLLAIGWSKAELLAAIEDLERTTIADIQTGS